MKISAVELFTVYGIYHGSAYPPGERQAKAADIYPEFNADGGSVSPEPGAPYQATYVQIVTDEGITGLWGPIQEYQAYLIAAYLRPFLIDRDPLATELLYDQMIRMDRHGRSGMFMTAVSAIDCALWDLKGKAWEQPVYRLLGGPTRPSVPAYASMLGYDTRPEPAAQIAVAAKDEGYTAQKWFFRYGPGDGMEGMARNIAMAEAVRSAVGDNYTLMFDAFMGWDVSYARQMLRALEPIRPFWMEEPIPPERISEFCKLRESSRVPLATGEHVYTRWQTKELLVAHAVDVLQNDPDWTGGITELVKVVTLASAFETPVVAHGHSLLAALHVAGSQSPAAVPFVEFLIRNQPGKQNFHTQFYQPVQGEVALPAKPGLGIELDEAKVERRESLPY